MKKIIFIRHWKTISNIENIYWWDNTTLTNKAINDTFLISNKLKNENISKIISSNLTRSVQTAEILSNTLNCKFEIWKELNEINCWEYLNTKKEKWINIIEKAFNSKNWENFDDVINRAILVIDKFRLINDDESILIVWHNAFTSIVFFILQNYIININNLLKYKKNWKFKNLEIKEIYL